MGDRRRFDEEVEIVLERAVLALAEGTPIFGRVAQERHEARDRDDRDAARPAVRLEGEARQHHVAAVRAAVEHRPVGVEAPVRPEPVVQRSDVANRVEPPAAVVEVLEALSVAGRPAHVRLHDREPLTGEVLHERDPHWAALRLRPAVDLEQHGRGVTDARVIGEERDRLAVERGEPIERRVDELVLHDAGRAVRQLHRLARRGVDEPRVPCRPR
jgi:hypothetical protein